MHSVNLWQSQFGVCLEHRLLLCSNIPMKSGRDTLMLIPVALSMVLMVESSWIFFFLFETCVHTYTQNGHSAQNERLNEVVIIVFPLHPLISRQV